MLVYIVKYSGTALFHYIMLQELWGHLLIQRIALYNTNTGFRIFIFGFVICVSTLLNFHLHCNSNW